MTHVQARARSAPRRPSRALGPSEGRPRGRPHCAKAVSFRGSLRYGRGPMANVIKAHITGTVWKIEVKAGDSVEEGTVVAILESMKMEMPVEADRDPRDRRPGRYRGPAARPSRVIRPRVRPHGAPESAQNMPLRAGAGIRRSCVSLRLSSLAPRSFSSLLVTTSPRPARPPRRRRRSRRPSLRLPRARRRPRFRIPRCPRGPCPLARAARCNPARPRSSR